MLTAQALRADARFRGVRVSKAHAIVLEAADDAGVRFTLDSGRRTMAEQAALVRQKGTWSPRNPHGAATPNRNAPHIRVGRANHALDVNSLDGGQARLAAFYRKNGVAIAFNVPGEAWHEDPVSEPELLAAANRLEPAADPLRGYTASERRWIREYDELVAQRRDVDRRRVLRRVMTEQRKRIWHAAQPRSAGGDGHGWTPLRARRYRSLLARTR
jgi:hypothetical protein